jgi:copper(I)-binding protein
MIFVSKFCVIFWMALGFFSAEILAAPKNLEGSVTVSSVHWRAPIPGQTVGVLYLTLKNQTASQYRLNDVDIEWARKAEFHQHFHEEGLMKMRKVSPLSLDPYKELTFVSGGLHIMIFGVDSSVANEPNLILKLLFNDDQFLSVKLSK